MIKAPKTKQERFSATTFKVAPENVDRKLGAIYGVAVITVGEALGHGYWMEGSFIDATKKEGNKKRSGLKCRFGHPNMSSTALGTFLGRFKNFRVDGEIARADLFLSNEAKDTPNGNLYDYVLNLAENDPEAFGTSISFRIDKYYKKTTEGKSVFVEYDWESDEWIDGFTDENRPEYEKDDKGNDKIYITLDKLWACDMVDDPAANPSGLFSNFSNETFAGQMTEFLDMHPHIFRLVNDNPEVMKSFMKKYKSYLKRKGLEMTDEEKKALEAKEGEEEEITTGDDKGADATDDDAGDNKDDDKKGGDADADDDKKDDDKEGDDADADDAKDDDKKGDDADADDDEKLSEGQKEFKKMKAEFGADFAANCFEKGMSFDQAKDAHYEVLKIKNKELETSSKEKTEKLDEVSGSLGLSTGLPASKPEATGAIGAARKEELKKSVGEDTAAVAGAIAEQMSKCTD